MWMQEDPWLVMAQKWPKITGGQARFGPVRPFENYLSKALGPFMDSTVKILFIKIPGSEVKNVKKEFWTS